MTNAMRADSEPVTSVMLVAEFTPQYQAVVSSESSLIEASLHLEEAENSYNVRQQELLDKLRELDIVDKEIHFTEGNNFAELHYAGRLAWYWASSNRSLAGVTGIITEVEVIKTAPTLHVDVAGKRKWQARHTYKVNPLNSVFVLNDVI